MYNILMRMKFNASLSTKQLFCIAWWSCTDAEIQPTYPWSQASRLQIYSNIIMLK